MRSLTQSVLTINPPMEQVLCARNAIIPVSGRNAKGEYENSQCPIHHKKPDSRCIKFHCPSGHDYETKNEIIK